jgi:F420-dependent oxidoreductase-like protein
MGGTVVRATCYALVMQISINGSATMVFPSVPNALADLKATKDEGFAGYWLAQVGLGDALTVFAAAGEATEGMEVGTAVIPTFPRHPYALAQQALMTQAAIPGKLIVGIGLSHQPSVEDNLRMRWERPIRHMSDYLDVLLPLLETGQVDHTGEFWSGQIAGGRPTETTPSVMLAALGPQMLDVAGRRTDGTILWLVGPRTIAEHIAPRINDAAAAAGRPAPRVVCSLPVCVTDDVAGARDLIGQFLVGYNELPSYRAMLDREGADGPADVAIVGDEAYVLEAMEGLAKAGTTDFAALPMSLDPEIVARTRACLRSFR